MRDLDPNLREERAFASESFCSTLFETEIGSADPLEFLDRAVHFANERLWGTLSAGLVVHPKVMKDPTLGGAMERAIDDLRYGVVGVNAWSGYVFAFVTPPWGAYPGSSLTRHPERPGLGPQHVDAGGGREGGAPASDHGDAEAGLFPLPPERPRPDAPDDGAGGERELDPGAGRDGSGDEGLNVTTGWAHRYVVFYPRAFPDPALPDLQDQLTATLHGHYAIQREVGHGGMAVIYLARDLKHDRDVALKVLHSRLAEVLGRERFLREIRMAAQLHHPHLLPLYDSGDAAGSLYYVVPFIEAGSLRDRLSRNSRLDLAASLQLAREVAEALDYAHRHNVVHRDIKPENILLDEGHAVVADFGIARAISEAADAQITQSGLLVGTPAYMSPEQAGEEEVDGRSDIYGLACVLFELLTGATPFAGQTPLGRSGPSAHRDGAPTLRSWDLGARPAGRDDGSRARPPCRGPFCYGGRVRRAARRGGE